MESVVKQRKGIQNTFSQRNKSNLTRQSVIIGNELIELKSEKNNCSFRNDFDPNNPIPITNDEEDFFNSNVSDEEEDQDDEDLEEEAEDSINEAGEDFNENEETIVDPDFDE